MKTVIIMIFKLFEHNAPTLESARQSMREDARREIGRNWLYQANDLS